MGWRFPSVSTSNLGAAFSSPSICHSPPFFLTHINKLRPKIQNLFLPHRSAVDQSGGHCGDAFCPPLSTQSAIGIAGHVKGFGVKPLGDFRRPPENQAFEATIPRSLFQALQECEDSRRAHGGGSASGGSTPRCPR